MITPLSYGMYGSFCGEVIAVKTTVALRLEPELMEAIRQRCKLLHETYSDVVSALLQGLVSLGDEDTIALWTQAQKYEMPVSEIVTGMLRAYVRTGEDG
jgi:hypothetical protein